MRTGQIVVGTDGTAHGKAAVEWAAREAARSRSMLRVVHAFDWEWGSARLDAGGDYFDLARQMADVVTSSAIDQARAAAPHLTVETDAYIGKPVSRLLEVAADADLTVVGNRGRGGFTSLLLGSVSQQVATHAPGPVVVVRGRDAITDGPVVAGVDESDAADHVLGVAFDAAGARSTGLTVVRTYLPPAPIWPGAMPASLVVPSELTEREYTRLDEQLAPWRRKYPEVPVHILVSSDSPAAALVELSGTAALVIVGSRGHGTLAGVLLGSTSLQLLHHADCPVLVARPRHTS